MHQYRTSVADGGPALNRTVRWDNDYEKGRSIVYKSVYEVGVLLSSEPCNNIMFSYLNWALYQVRTYRR